MTLRMTGHNVLVKQNPKEMETAGGIVLAQTDSQRAAPRGLVLAVGTEVKEINEGDKVIWGDYSGQIIEEHNDGAVTRVMTEDDILAVEV